MVQAKSITWIERIRHGRRSGYSNLVIVASDDPKRKSELLAHLTVNGLVSGKSQRPEEVYVYSTWQSLRRYDEQTEAFQPVENGMKMPLGGALGWTDKKMREHKPNDTGTRPVILVVESYVEKLPGLDQTLVDFILDEGLQVNWSTLIIFVHSLAVVSEQVRKMSLVITPDIATEEERERIITDFLSNVNEARKSKPIKVSKDAMRQAVALTAGLNLNQVEAVVAESIFVYDALNLAHLADFKSREINKLGYIKVTQTPKFGFEAIGGYDRIKDWLKANIVEVVKNRSGAEALAIAWPKGVVTWGEPGTGKTVISKALAYECGLPFFELAMSQIKSKYVGDSEQRLERAIQIINANSPCLVFIDEIDRLGGREGGDHDGGTSRELFSMLLQWLGDEERTAILVGTTNEPEHCDPAFRRPGRIDAWLPVRYPDVKARRAILDVHTKVKTKVPLDEAVDLDALAERMEFYSGADCQDVIEMAKRNALADGAKKVSQQNFEDAFNHKYIPVDARRQTVERYDQMAQRVCTDVRFMGNLGATKPATASRAQMVAQSQE